MYSRFLERPVTRRALEGRKRSRRKLLLRPTLVFALKVAALAASLLFAACSQIDKSASAEKHYIEPAKQPKIPASTTALRVCADPNNLPFSNKAGEGFENKIAAVIADELHRPVEYTWWAQRRGFFRNTLRAGLCDVVIGVPASFELAETTRPYYRSTYVFVTRKDRDLDIRSFDDPKLRELKIGVQLVGDDGANTPPAHALHSRGIVENVRGFTLYGDYDENDPPARVIDAVVSGAVDVAVVWGPLAGYFAARHKAPLTLTPVSPEIDLPYLPFVYDISVGVRRGEDDLKNSIDGILVKRRADLEKILAAYGLPRPRGKEGV